MDKKTLIIGAILLVAAVGGMLLSSGLSSGPSSSGSVPAATPTNPDDPAIRGLKIN